MSTIDLQTVAVGALMAGAAVWCWHELKNTTRHWRSATFVTVIVAVAATIASEVIGGRHRGFNALGSGLAIGGWVVVAVLARLRR